MPFSQRPEYEMPAALACENRGLERSQVPAPRRLVAEGALEVAHRLGQRSLTTAHLFVAALESPDPHIAELRLNIRNVRDIAAEIAEAPLGDDHD